LAHRAISFTISRQAPWPELRPGKYPRLTIIDGHALPSSTTAYAGFGFAMLLTAPIDNAF